MSNVKKRLSVWTGLAIAPAKSNAKKFSESRTARVWMASLATVRQDDSPTAQAEVKDAFKRTAALVRDGHVYLDYAPTADQYLEMPSIDSAHYMQAIMYWSIRFACTPDDLVEAYARLGSGAPLYHVQILIENIAREDQQLTGWLGTAGGSGLFSQTVPLYDATKPSPL